MKKKIFIVLLMLSFWLPSINVYASQHIDYEVSFELTDDWEFIEVYNYNDFKYWKYESNDYGTLVVGITDMYEELSNKKELSRTEIDNSFYSKNDIKKMIEKEYDVDSVTIEQYGDYDFFVAYITYSYKTEVIVNGEVGYNTAYSPAEIDITICNGYMLMFTHTNFTRDTMILLDGTKGKDTESINNHISILESVDLSSIEPSEDSKPKSDDTSKEPNYIENFIVGAVSAMIFCLVPQLVKLVKRKKKEQE